ncbi:molybdate ABC transporter substrate-binding protein [Alkalitalea saponilacus]|uniref:Molybdate transport system substrate-binding protein n=1 Tax=Alkalitalea saponilacus TaxID=889453 RepID=A0A1T5GNQ6_9BACT|nr:molybdate ABC transporter substrate-binding protein [Alkalitalea saponilacus]ASB48248.1 molybdate ABC transporter substrate-binding protein [Alkalitalea saponilacus]SKC10046.1 molybdate transport system substrate-binding protein [Alkalitalea saponilacus]
MRIIPTILLLILCITGHAQRVRIAAAADLRFAMDEIVAAYKSEHPNVNLEVIYGSSGNAYTQISNGGAPYDIYFSADISYPQRLYEAGLTVHEPTLYAIGRIALWSSSIDVSKGFSVLSENSRARIAIANPSHAPYGERAVEALTYMGLYDKVKSQLIYGENISQAAQFCLTGNAQIGILALALVMSPNMQTKGNYYLIDDGTHNSLQQGFVILNRAKDNALAHDFARYISSPPAITILEKYGFELPERTTRRYINREKRSSDDFM